MKKIFLSICILTIIGFTSCKKEVKTIKKSQVNITTTTNFGVRGNCGMCKKTIEKAAKSVEGVANAVWNIKKKNIEVSFDSIQTDLTAIHTAIAKSGYDTEKTIRNKEVYKQLPACCQYETEMEMNLE